MRKLPYHFIKILLAIVLCASNKVAANTCEENAREEQDVPTIEMDAFTPLFPVQRMLALPSELLIHIADYINPLHNNGANALHYLTEHNDAVERAFYPFANNLEDDLDIEDILQIDQLTPRQLHYSQAQVVLNHPSLAQQYRQFSNIHINSTPLGLQDIVHVNDQLNENNFYAIVHENQPLRMGILYRQVRSTFSRARDEQIEYLFAFGGHSFRTIQHIGRNQERLGAAPNYRPQRINPGVYYRINGIASYLYRNIKESRFQLVSPVTEENMKALYDWISFFVLAPSCSDFHPNFRDLPPGGGPPPPAGFGGGNLGAAGIGAR